MSPIFQSDTRPVPIGCFEQNGAVWFTHVPPTPITYSPVQFSPNEYVLEGAHFGVASPISPEFHYGYLNTVPTPQLEPLEELTKHVLEFSIGSSGEPRNSLVEDFPFTHNSQKQGRRMNGKKGHVRRLSVSTKHLFAGNENPGSAPSGNAIFEGRALRKVLFFLSPLAKNRADSYFSLELPGVGTLLGEVEQKFCRYTVHQFAVFKIELAHYMYHI